jgi:spore germination cell wall hydrolase CwlJ-like protein
METLQERMDLPKAEDALPRLDFWDGSFNYYKNKNMSWAWVLSLATIKIFKHHNFMRKKILSTW